jgi:uncharacterized protein (UPF0147 family)
MRFMHAADVAELKEMCDSYADLNEELTAENNKLAAEAKELLRVRGELRDSNEELHKRCALLQVTAEEAARKASTAKETLSSKARHLTVRESSAISHGITDCLCPVTFPSAISSACA